MESKDEAIDDVAVNKLVQVEEITPIEQLDPKQTEMIIQILKNLQKGFSPEEMEIVNTWVDDHTIYRYLRARNFHLKDSEKMLRESIKWRASYKPHLLKAKDVESQLVMGHIYIPGTDNRGRPIVVFKVHTEKDPHDTDERIKFVVYSLEKAISRMKNLETMIWFVDCRGFNVKYNGDLGLAKKFVGTLQDHYPERLGEMFVFDAPGVFKTFWKVVNPFIDPKTKKKVCFLETSSPDIQKILGKKFDLEKLDKCFGGNLDFKFDPQSYVADVSQGE
eukprot:TRINITY_DN3608_c0_g1_i1.p1 TRINITY_DN3608_c0_g1~~TRINITY_DN3608_c0_g1_i1.p1  ORF type:complete len:298 (-),score=115.85 TRINITY_DN3608_c0_g1_i1:86-913(-)